jgi:acetate kinase
MNEIAYTMPIRLNKEENDQIAGFKDKKSGIISTDDSKFKVIVVPTDEESIILKDTYELYQQYKVEYQDAYQKKIGVR